jgi:hypothetical protein
MWGPNWVLDQSMLVNHRCKHRSHKREYGVSLDGVELVEVEPDCVSTVSPALATLAYSNTNQTLSWRPDPAGSFGPAVSIANGKLFIPGPQDSQEAFILGGSSFTINAGVNDRIYIDMDEKGPVVIQLVTGLPSPSVAQVSSDINSAMAAHPAYGVPYNSVASTYNSKLLLKAVASEDSSIQIGHGQYNAAPVLFGIENNNIMYDPALVQGAIITNIYGNITLIDNFTIEYECDDTGSDTIRKIRFAYSPALITASTWTTINNDGQYTLTDSNSVSINISVIASDMEINTGVLQLYTYTGTSGYQILEKNIRETKGLWVSVNTAALPSFNTSATVDIIDDAVVTPSAPETPDNWILSSYTGVTTELLPSRISDDRQEEKDRQGSGWHGLGEGRRRAEG